MTISNERLVEIAREYQDMIENVRSSRHLEDGPGAASAFYMSCSLGEIMSMATEIQASRAIPRGEGKAYLHVPAGNVFKPSDYAVHVAQWKRQFADTHSPEEIEADFEPLYLSPSVCKGKVMEITAKAIGAAMQEAWDEICSDTGYHPLDIQQLGEGELSFRPDHWARFTAMYLTAALSQEGE